MSLDESQLETAALDWFQELGYAFAHGPHLATLPPKVLRGEMNVAESESRLEAVT
jgi:hypothetical protein